MDHTPENWSEIRKKPNLLYFNTSSFLLVDLSVKLDQTDLIWIQLLSMTHCAVQV